MKLMRLLIDLGGLVGMRRPWSRGSRPVTHDERGDPPVQPAQDLVPDVSRAAQVPARVLKPLQKHLRPVLAQRELRGQLSRAELAQNSLAVLGGTPEAAKVHQPERVKQLVGLESEGDVVLAVLGDEPLVDLGEMQALCGGAPQTPQGRPNDAHPRLVRPRLELVQCQYVAEVCRPGVAHSEKVIAELLDP